MTAVALGILALSLSVVLYAHVGYPVLLALLARLRPRRAPRGGGELPRPSVSIVVAAWNEEAVIAAKVDNALAQDYPADRLEVVVASDGSTDRTSELVSARAGPRVRLVEVSPRGGKARALRHGVAVARGDVLVLTDANAMFERDAVSRLVDRLVAPGAEDVSCAFGCVEIRPEGCPYGASEGLFYRVERAIQRDESALDSAVGVDGALYAIRREAFVPPPDGAILDDLEVAIEATRGGRRVIYEPLARGWEDATPTLAQEVRRKSRIVAGAIQALRAGRMMPDRERRLLWFLFASHKLVRWAQPPFLGLALVAAAVAAPGSAVAAGALAAQLALYLGALAGLGLQGRVDLGTLSLPLYVVAMHAAGLAGLVRGLRGRQGAAWQRADRRPLPVGGA